MRPINPWKKTSKLSFLNSIFKVTLHQGNKLARKAKELNDIKVKISSDDVKITKVTPQHLRDRLAQKIKELNKVTDEILLTKVTPQHPRDRLARKVKELDKATDEILLTKKTPQHSRDRLTRKVKEFKDETLKKMSVNIRDLDEK